MSGTIQRFYKTPESILDYQVQIAVGDSSIRDTPAVTIVGYDGATAGAPVVDSSSVAGAVVVVRVSGGARRTKWYIPCAGHP